MSQRPGAAPLVVVHPDKNAVRLPVLVTGSYALSPMLLGRACC